MLLTALILLSTPQSCVDTRQQCRACPPDRKQAEGKQGCSSVGIACQPLHRVCRPVAAPPPADPRRRDKSAR